LKPWTLQFLKRSVCAVGCVERPNDGVIGFVAAEVNPPLFAGEVAVLQAGMDFG
jgi:hypothetical protein